MHPAGFDLVISAPQHNAGMIAQPLYLFYRLLPHILLESRVARHHVTAEHELLPHHDPQFIANIVKIIGLVICSSPRAHHVHVGIAGRLKNHAMPLGSYTIGKAVKGDYVRAFGKDRNAVNHKGEALAPLVRGAPQLERAQTSLDLAGCNSLFPRANGYGKGVAILRSISRWIPEPGRCDA